MLNSHMQHFGISYLVSAVCLCIGAYWGFSLGGMNGLLHAVWITLILGVMEVSLSFDNAVVNAAVLRHWNAFWQKLFLTVGILVAVFGMRLLFPLVIVSFAADLGLMDVWRLALDKPEEYATHLTNHHAEVAAFGGSFLMLVFLNFLFDEDKELHWLGWIEEKMGLLGKVGSVSILITLASIVGCLSLVPENKQLVVLLAGVWGILVYVGVDVISGFLEKEETEDPTVADVVKRGGIGGFLYLEVLDASFSFDGVIGAFAITKDVVIIMLGLGIGAMFVRSITVYLVHKGTLEAYAFLEHGAHYAIGALAVIMLLSMKYHIPEVITGLIGVVLIGLSIWSSVRHNREKLAAEKQAAGSA